MTHSTQQQAQRSHCDQGFSLVELMGALTIVVLMVLALQGSLFSSVQLRKVNGALAQRHNQAYDFMQRLTVLPFGSASDNTVLASQLSELFDDDQDLGSITLKQVETPVGSPGHTFETVLDGVRTRWRAAVHNDLDSDGLATGPREGRADLLVVELFAEDRLMFRTIRAATVPNTVKD